MIALEFLVSFTLLGACILWVGSRYVSVQDRWIYFLALTLKILVGWGLAVLYDRYYHFPSADTFRFHKGLVDFSRVIFSHPLLAFDIFWSTESYGYMFQIAEVATRARVGFFIKILFFINLVCFDNYWLLSAWLSFFSIVGSVILVKCILENFPNAKWAAWLSFVFIPSFFFWTSGLLKESIMWTVICVLISIYLKIKRDWTKVSISQWIVFVLLFWILFGIKFYFFSALLTSFALGMVIPEKAYMDRKLLFRFGLGAVLIIGCLLLINTISPQLSYANFLESLVTNHDLTVRSSLKSKFNGGFVQFNNLEPTWSSILNNAPMAIFSSLFRPLLWEAQGVFQLLVSFQAFIVFVFFVAQVVGLIKHRIIVRRMDLMVPIIYYILLTSALLAIASPNFGALERYKSGFYPFFVFIILFKNPLLDKLVQIFSQSTKKI